LPTCHGQGPRGVFPPEVRAQATALACSLPREQGVPLGRWSCAEIARRLLALGVVVHIAGSTVWRWLSQEGLKPWRYHAWQHLLDPQAFLALARPVLRLYAQARELLRQGVWVVCVDEKTSIQARAREQAPQAAGPGQPVHLAPRYRRQGALQLFAGLSVADGEVLGQCRSRKRFVDFQGFLTEVLIPAALQRGVKTLALILDHGSTHAPKRLEQWLHQQAAAQHGALAIQVYWLPKNASWLDQIEVWFSILQRKLLQPNHFTSLQELEQMILAFIAHHNQTAQPIHWSYTTQQLEAKLGVN